MAKKLAFSGHSVHVWNRSPEPAQELQSYMSTVVVAESIADLVKSLPVPKIIWLMLPAGDVTEDALVKVFAGCSQGDIVIDGGNAHYAVTQKRFVTAGDRGVRYLGIGVAGGVVAANSGYPLMVGGDRTAYDEIKPILDTLAHPSGGHAYFGSGGAGHFVKMVHNGIEYGLMQSLGEGYGILKNSPYNLDLPEVTRLWQKGTLVSGFMLDRTLEAITPDPGLTDVVGIIGELGEGKWTVVEAHKTGQPVDVISTALDFRLRSQTDVKLQETFAAKLVASLRAAFGGHKVEKSEKIKPS